MEKQFIACREKIRLLTALGQIATLAAAKFPEGSTQRESLLREANKCAEDAAATLETMELYAAYLLPCPPDRV